MDAKPLPIKCSRCQLLHLQTTRKYGECPWCGSEGYFLCDAEGNRLRDVNAWQAVTVPGNFPRKKQRYFKPEAPVTPVVPNETATANSPLDCGCAAAECECWRKDF